MKAKLIKDLKPGEYFTTKPIETPSESQVWVRDGYCRDVKKYEVYKFADIGVWRLWKGSRVVYVDFEF